SGLPAGTWSGRPAATADRPRTNPTAAPPNEPNGVLGRLGRPGGRPPPTSGGLPERTEYRFRRPALRNHHRPSRLDLPERTRPGLTAAAPAGRRRETKPTAPRPPSSPPR